MATPKDVVWDPDPHTREKLRLLRSYLDAWWTIILSSDFPEATYVDGFAGPGEYKNGEDGSPVVAIRALLAHRDKDWWGKKARVVPAVLSKWRDRHRTNPVIDQDPQGGRIDRNARVRLPREPPQQRVSEQQMLDFTPGD